MSEDLKKEEIKVEDNIIEKSIDPMKGKSLMRQIVIETDGDNIHLVKAQVSGYIELVAILQNLIEYIKNKNNVTKNTTGEDK